MNPLYLYPDIAIHYFIDSAFNHSLFSNDLFITHHLNLFGYQMTESTVWVTFLFNWYYGLLFYCSIFFKTLTLLKIFAWIQNFLSVIFLKRIFKHYSTSMQMILLISFQLLFFTMDTFQGGLPRGLGCVFVLAFIDCLINQKQKGCIGIIIITAFNYPHLLPFMFTSFFIKRLSNSKTKPLKQRIHNLITLPFLAFVIILFFFYSKGFYSNVFESDLARDGYSSYKSKVFLSSYNFMLKTKDFMLNTLLNGDDHSVFYPCIFAIYLCFAILIIFKRHHLLQIKNIFKTFSVILYGSIISCLILFSPWFFGCESVFFFHIGAKQLKYTLPFLLCLIFTPSWSAFIGKRAVIILFCLYSCFYLFIFKASTDYSAYKNIYEFIKSIPEKSMIAGFHEDTEMIPLYAGRMVYSMYTWAELPGSSSFHIEQKRRAKQIRKMVELKDKNELIDFTVKEKISHYLINLHKPLIGKKIMKNLLHPIKSSSPFKILFNDSRFILVVFQPDLSLKHFENPNEQVSNNHSRV